MLPIVGGGIAPIAGGAGGTGIRVPDAGFSQPDGATGSTGGRGAGLLRGFGRACGSGFHSVGRA
ncbi:hypothetical protein [Burkholderia multivorans]|uniref:hypothetical protein n=1 Tax=Burkholderia multivorans TaxID=87883 RepID=UPI001F3CFCA2|nr:hypothetical protein [Burkholderia multivorans]MDI3301475.1 hypothetical protein [Burkholderia multivorans]